MSKQKMTIQARTGKIVEPRGSLNMRIEGSGTPGIIARISGFVNQ